MSTEALADPSAVRKFAAMLQFETDPDVIFNEASQRLANGKPWDKEGQYYVGRKLIFAAGIGSQYTVTEAVPEQYAPFAVSFTRQLIKEHECRSASEIATAEAAAIGYTNFICHSKLSGIYPHETIHYKQADRSFRQYLSSLSALKQMKAPPVQVNVVRANTAFVAQNQQVNATSKEETETYEPK